MTAASDAEQLPPRRLLLVGRRAERLSHLSAAFGARGYRVATAAPGPDLWQAISSHDPQMVAIEMGGPGARGLDDLTSIKQLIPEDHFVPVIALFEEKTASAIIRTFQMGADDFLIEPFDVFELALRLEVLWRIKVLQDEILAANRRLHALAISDDLTGLCNQREFKRRLKLELDRIERFNIPVSLIFFDCDRFKQVNDTCGHAMGSHVLREVARIMVANLREVDVLCRYGGDEFVLALPGCPLDDAERVAERLRSLVAMTGFRLGADEVYITLSMGVAHADGGEPLTPERLLARADAALYVAKAQGRDQVRRYHPKMKVAKPS